ncbi:DUF805 domain-containing protein [Neorhodopirellula pilleata]|uniref:DUF805 domain-containing protein n=1 Tax=Neorhodopirellula pilleata TaxID=2714738 RepID=A0A5C6A193_9BACT|nr:DUF805 domain-containing protein [Neorhodopirellula pilleata]TWT93097.1 hypothetical protein Pla100_44140 [Neorhodopirellula pilleata]
MSEQPNAILLHPCRWFVVDGPVTRSEYFTLGIALSLVKYAIEFSVILFLTGHLFSPWEFLNPWLNSKAGFLDASPELAIVWLLFTIPFVMIAVSMSIRRAADAGRSPWCGLFMMVPLLNYFVMTVLSILPTWTGTSDLPEDRDGHVAQAAFAPPAPVRDDESEEWENPYAPRRPSATAAFYPALGIGVLIQVVVGLLSVWVLREYGLILFFTTPFFAGAASGGFFNLQYKYSAGLLFLLIAVMNLVSYAAMLCVGLDGAICLFMAFPLLWPVSFFGGLLGRSIVTSRLRGRDERRGLYASMMLLPLALLLEPLDHHRQLHRVDTTVIVNAPTPEVWKQVVAFPEITAEPAWFFRAGIAAPIRARIECTGVGACRYCEFTTGAFVEPITQWDEPVTAKQSGKLGFDVQSQPLPMEEWTPFSGLHPPHLDDGFVSRRGQFVLEPLPDGRTRLTGTTWYDIDVRPRLYWKIWADPTIHAIHRRVLDHIQTVCESATP